MLQPIFLPENIEFAQDGDNSATFSIHPYHPGYGPTVGNALRRVLLSSLPGAAITFMRIEGIDHEFTAIPGVKEDVVSLILNLKRVRLSSTSSDPIEIRLESKGEGVIKAGDFKTPPEVTIANPDQVIAHITDSKAKLEMIATVEQGRGYVPSEARETQRRPIGTIALDAIFTPVERVSFNVENVRVGQATNYHKLSLTITTDGTVAPREALKQAASILADHFKELTGDFEAALTAHRPVEVAPEPVEETVAAPENTLNLMQLPSRVHNALERVGITTVEQVLELSDEQIQDIPGLGAKAVSDIKKSRDEFRVKAEEEKASKEAE
jgi:DNA-directed RNA polymerase subunit alpha